MKRSLSYLALIHLFEALRVIRVTHGTSVIRGFTILAATVLVGNGLWGGKCNA